MYKATALFALAVVSAFAQRPYGDSRVFAPVPDLPGYPEGIVVSKGKVYVSGPANFGVPGNNVPSRIHVFDLDTAAALPDIVIEGQVPFAPKALSSITADYKGNLYVLDVIRGVIKINPQTNQQSVYAGPFPVVYQSPYQQGPSLPNDLAFDKKGNLYVTDSFQATIFRIPPGGGAPQPWITDPRLDGIFGANGIRFDKKGENVYVTVTLDGNFGGYLYKLPVKETPLPSDLTLVQTFPGQAPDGIAFGKKGDLYIALALTNQIAVLKPNGSLQILNGPAQSPNGAVPWLNPANIAFNDKAGTLLVTNHASLVPNPVFNIFDVFVDDKAAHLFAAEGQ
ncbi:MAG: SMP-30/gluconolactonase/LRE family protein [Bryobacteraceae bacterium]|nr:SMP-30/gluconolactonase/LRE family protein [Bryobacteraceae bacterium]